MQFDKRSVAKIKKEFLEKLCTSFGCDLDTATNEQLYQALAMTVRDEIMERRSASRGTRKQNGAKKVYYLSAEFLVGRALHNNIVNLVNEKNYLQALEELGLDKNILFEIEPEPGLGNGGLGRLASCFLDSLSALRLPAMGCTIRYEFGLFRQRLVDGYQVEVPDNWLDSGNIWEIPRPAETVEVHFGGQVLPYDDHGRMRFQHVNYSTVEAVPYDIPVIGYDNTMVNMLRTWSARSPKRIDMLSFNSGQYVKAMAERELAEVISKVLYPNDDSYQGKELRLKQQYFFSSASIQYAVSDFLKTYGPQWRIFPDKVAVHINDTHPAVAIPELMRILIDEHDLDWDVAEQICYKTFAYTNHTVLQEALERWPEQLFAEQLPRIYMILQEMNRRVCAKLWEAYPGQWERIGRMSIVGYNQIHMANLSVACTHSVNGVSGIHTDILKKQTFHDFYLIDPQKFISITNGITHRRWLLQCNPNLAELIDQAIGDGWRKDMNQLSRLAPFADDAAFREKFASVKYYNKLRFTDRMRRMQNLEINPDSIFDTQAKRLHEYKRQLMNALGILMMYNTIVEKPQGNYLPRTFIFGAKAAPGYHRAKLTIKLINAIAELVKKHPVASKYINVVFVENYCVSQAEVLIPATEVSEQISTAGKEASGTGNMKFMMNGALTIGTMDGANCEIHDAVGADNIYIFGLTADEVDRGYTNYRSSEVYETNPSIRKVMEQLIDGTLSPDNPRMFQEIHHALLFGDGGGMADPYFVLKDLPQYYFAQQRISQDYTDKDTWLRKAVLNTAYSGIFSSDRTISEYNDRIWHLKPLDV
ncbi:MAG: glycogen/starch/alpha-glucan phosphorylase [Christensenellales bacterium]|nr:glycogen/starch/alpha-glucan phosphorylase [Christensenellales bacterium]